MANTTDKVLSYREQKQADDIERIVTQLNTVASSDIPKLQERIFKEVFLPLFAGDEELPYPVTFDTWVNINKGIGGAYSEVHIVDETGKVIFTVPPLMDRGTINPISDNTVSVGHIVTTASQYARIHPNQGTRYLNTQLDKKALMMRVPANVINNLEIWNSIFKRYGRPEIMAVNKVVANNTPVIGEFDEFEPL